jgi:hypothetical protein
MVKFRPLAEANRFCLKRWNLHAFAGPEIFSARAQNEGLDRASVFLNSSIPQFFN